MRLMAALSDKDLLARLVSFDSISAKSNSPIAGFVADYLTANSGGAIRIEQIEHANSSTGKLNLIASCGPDLAKNTGRNGLVLCGHLDVVPAAEPDWHSDPFTLIERDGSLIARGAADMKGFDALAINLLLSAAQHADKLTHPLVLLLTFDEEVGSIGAKHFVDHYSGTGTLPRHCIIGEPTMLRAVRMHKGHLVLRIILHGKAAHSGSPHLGANAIEPAGEILLALRSLRQRFENLNLETSRYFADVPHPVLNVVTIFGGVATNVIPDQCTIEVGIRLMPGQHREGVIAEVEEVVRDAANNTPIEFVLLRENPPLLTDDDAPMHRAICDLLGQRESIGVSYASDGGWLSTLGIDCILFGPGMIEVAHKPNESLPVAEFTRARTLLQELISQFCMADAPIAT
jgi:acetylornithine deacetylase